MAYRSIAWLMSQAAAAPTANPTAGPSRRTCTENSAQSATPDASALATAIRIRSMGKTTTSLVPASIDVQGLAHGARYASVAHHVAQDYRVGRGQDGAQEQRLHHRGPEQEVRPGGHDRDDDQGSRTQREHRDGSGALHALVTDPHAFEAEDEGQRERSHRLQKRVLRAEHEDAQTVLPEQKSQTQKDYRKRDRRSLHEPRGETCDGEDHGDQSKGREQVGQRRLS